MKKIVYISLLLGLCLEIRMHGMFRRSAARVVPPAASGYDHRIVADIPMPETPASMFSRARQATAQGVAAKVGAVGQGFTAKVMGAQAAAAAQKEAWRQMFAASRSRMGAAMRGVKIPAMTAGTGAVVGGTGVAIHEGVGIDELRGQVQTISEMTPELGDAKQESIWRSLFDAPYTRLLYALSRADLEGEFVGTHEKNLQMEDEVFRKAQAREFQRNAGKKFWESGASHERRIRQALAQQNQAVKIHEKKQKEVRGRLEDLEHLERHELVDELRALKPDILLKERERQQEEILSHVYFPSARQRVADIIRP